MGGIFGSSMIGGIFCVWWFLELFTISGIVGAGWTMAYLIHLIHLIFSRPWLDLFGIGRIIGNFGIALRFFKGLRGW